MIFNVTGGGAGMSGAQLTVNAPAGATVTVSKDGKSKSKVADSAGVAVFKGLSSGEWTVTITDGDQEKQKTVAITADYSIPIYFLFPLYRNGNEFTSTTGGFINDSKYIEASSPADRHGLAASSFEKGDSTIKMSLEEPSGWAITSMRTSKLINLDYFDTLTIKYKFSTGNTNSRANLFVIGPEGTYISDQAIAILNLAADRDSVVEKSLDIRDITGDYYIGAYICPNDENVAATFELFELNLK